MGQIKRLPATKGRRLPRELIYEVIKCTELQKWSHCQMRGVSAAVLDTYIMKRFQKKVKMEQKLKDYTTFLTNKITGQANYASNAKQLTITILNIIIEKEGNNSLAIILKTYINSNNNDRIEKLLDKIQSQIKSYSVTEANNLHTELTKIDNSLNTYGDKFVETVSSFYLGYLAYECESFGGFTAGHYIYELIKSVYKKNYNARKMLEFAVEIGTREGAFEVRMKILQYLAGQIGKSDGVEMTKFFRDEAEYKEALAWDKDRPARVPSVQHSKFDFRKAITFAK